MKPHAHGIHDDLNAVLGHPLYPLGEAVQRLQDERSLLMEEWNELTVLTRSICRHRHLRFAGDAFDWLLEKIGVFRDDVREHAAWAEEQLRPLLERAIGDGSVRIDDLDAMFRRAESRLEQFRAGLAAASSDPARAREIPELLLKTTRAFETLFRLEGELLDELWEGTDTG